MARVPATNRYCINLHDTLAQETCKKDGKELITHFVVVKNTPFLINISTKDASVNFRKTKINASLIYDCEPRREVSLIRSSPLEYVTHLSSNGELITIEARIHVLTSQNENSLFRVSLKFNDEELATEPLKVISKADNLKKDKNSKSPSSSKNNKKRGASDAFGDTLQRIEQQQQEQKNLIDMLYQQNQLLMTHFQSPPSPQHSVPSTPIMSSSIPSVPSPELSISSPSSNDTTELATERELHDCLSTFKSFLHTYSSISNMERPNKIRLLTQMLSSSELSALSSFTECLQTSQPATPSSTNEYMTGDTLASFSINDVFESSSLLKFEVSESSPEHDGPVELSEHEAPTSLLGSWLDFI